VAKTTIPVVDGEYRPVRVNKISLLQEQEILKKELKTITKALTKTSTRDSLYETIVDTRNKINIKLQAIEKKIYFLRVTGKAYGDKVESFAPEE
jgi:hypothetical protein